MNIAIFSSRFPIFSQTFIATQANDISNSGHNVSILSDKVEGVSDILNSDVKVYEIGRFPNTRIVQFILLTFYVFKSICFLKYKKIKDVIFDLDSGFSMKYNLIYMLSKSERIKLDWVICHFGNNAVYLQKMRDIGILESKIAVVFHAHELSKYSTLNKSIRGYCRIAKKIDLALPISDFWVSDLKRYGFENKKIFVVRTGVDIRKFEFRKEYNRIDEFRLLYVGRLTEKKGIFDLLNSISLIKEKINIKLDIVGDGELKQEVGGLIESLSLVDNVKLHGKKNSSEIYNFLSTSDAYVLPSKKAVGGDMEGIPVSIMEAMATGVVVISTIHSGIPELISHGETGFLAKENDILDLAKNILIASELNKDDYQNIVRKARHVIESNFNSALECEKLLSILKSDY